MPKHIDTESTIDYIYFGTKINERRQEMEKTLDEMLYEKLRQTRRSMHRLNGRRNAPGFCHDNTQPDMNRGRHWRDEEPGGFPPHERGFDRRPPRGCFPDAPEFPERPEEQEFPKEDGMHRFPGPEGREMRPRRRLPRERILTLINEAGDTGIHQKELVRQLGINPSSVSELTDKLETDGYIQRSADPDDKRATLITLTEKGRARAFEVADERAEMLHTLFRNLSDEEKQTLLELLDKITAEQPE